jgi:hypothetical protein
MASGFHGARNALIVRFYEEFPSRFDAEHLPQGFEEYFGKQEARQLAAQMKAEQRARQEQEGGPEDWL